MSDPRDDLAALLLPILRRHHEGRISTGDPWDEDPYQDAHKPGWWDDDATELAQAAIAAGWVRCLHTNTSGFSNNNGPWEMRCTKCGKEWTAQHRAADELTRHDQDAGHYGVVYESRKGALLGPGSGITTAEQARAVSDALRGRRTDQHEPDEG